MLTQVVVSVKYILKRHCRALDQVHRLSQTFSKLWPKSSIIFQFQIVKDQYCLFVYV